MTVPSLPVSHFILIKTNLSFSALKTLFYCPTISNDLNHLLERGTCWSKHQDIRGFRSFFSRFSALSNDQRMTPSSNFSSFKRYNSPIIQSRSFTAITCTQALPIGSLSNRVKAEEAQELLPGQTTSDATISQPHSPGRIESLPIIGC